MVLKWPGSTSDTELVNGPMENAKTFGTISAYFIQNPILIYTFCTINLWATIRLWPNSSEINNETEIPKNLQIYGLNDCTSLDLRNSSNCYAVIYAPNADFVLHNSVTIYGAIVCNTFEIKNSGTIMYDASLEDESFEPVPTDLTVTKWEEDTKTKDKVKDK